MYSVLDYVKMFVQVGFLAWVFYRFYEAVVQTKAQQIVRVIVVYAALYAVSYTLRLSVLTCFPQQASSDWTLTAHWIKKRWVKYWRISVWGR